MTMQHRKGAFEGKIVIRAEAWMKRDGAAASNRLRIDHLSMASRA
jgi:hypothetical protein